jgi:hypothetical protein
MVFAVETIILEIGRDFGIPQSPVEEQQIHAKPKPGSNAGAVKSHWLGRRQPP